MSNIFCTTLLSSYKRPLLLMKAVESLQAKANADEYEIIIRLSKEDTNCQQQAIDLMAAYKNVTVIVGNNRGYEAIGDYFTESAKYAKGKWVNIFDDDMTLEGASWWDELKQAPEDRFVLCEYYRCGGSGYGPGSCDGSGIAWWVKNGVWKQYGQPAIGHPPDSWMRNLLVEANGIQIHHLKGVLLNHQWQRPTDGNR